jgi:F0F1-type ATP synthase assembly protein I
MVVERPEQGQAGTYAALAQVGTEMVAPVLAGLVLDHYTGWRPWWTVGGAVFGLVGGISHLVAITNSRQAKKGPKQPGQP